MKIVSTLSFLFLITLVFGCSQEPAQEPDKAQESTGSAAKKKPLDLAGLYPEGEQISGLASVDRYREFDRGGLFEYMNGGAEVYLALDFVRVGTREYTTTLGEDIYLTVEIYDMGRSEHARQIFQRESLAGSPSADVGEVSAISGGALEFVHTQYYVRVRCDDMGAAVDRLLAGMAHYLQDRLEAGV